VSSRPFRIAHLSDPHLGPLPPMRLADLAGKRLTGFLNWHQTRKRIHDMAALRRLVADISAAAPDLVLLGGDIANIGLPAEFLAARRFVESLGPRGQVFLVPGNHDIYVRASLPALRATLGPWIGEGETAADFPYALRRGRIGIVALNSGAPSLPLLATGRLGSAQIVAAGAMLRAMRAEGLFRVILVHHAPHVGGSRIFRNLLDAPAFESMLREAGADLVLHGHNHCASLAFRPGPDRAVPILGVGSASASGGSHNHHATWQCIDIDGNDAAVEVRRLLPDGGFSGEVISLAGPSAGAA
jgi:3',5'-cyclic AMP phosphodiesterase CpdA